MHSVAMTAITVLFDIDGTLLDTSGAGRRAFISGLNKVWDWHDDLAYVDFAGNTDLNVLRQVMRHHQVEMSPAQVAATISAIVGELERMLMPHHTTVFPGVAVLLEELAARSVGLGLVTGNMEACAWTKLRSAGLAAWFQFGAFGDYSPDRRRIAEHARTLAWHRIMGERGPLALVGDTPSDIDAAHHIQACAIAVATGKYSRPQLLAAGADHVLPDLSDLPRVLALLGLK